MSAEVGGAIWLPLLVALGMALLTAGSYAELVTKYPRAGGAAVFAERAYRTPIVSFVIGFCMLAAGVTSAAGLAIAFAGDYLATFIDIPPVLGALCFLVIVGLINLRGIKESVRANVVMTAIEVSGLVLVVVLVSVMLGSGHGDLSRVVEFKPEVNPVLGTFGAALIAYYSFVGFETSANVAEEVTNPRRLYPRALFGALGTAGLVYVLVGLAATTAVEPGRLASSSGPLLEVVKATGIGVPAWLFSLIALIAVANGALLTLIMSSRLAYGMSEHGLLPAPLSRVLPHRKTPWVAIVVTTLVAMVLATIGDLTVLAETVVLLLLFVFLSTNIAVLVLRRDHVEHDHFRIPAVFPVLAALSCLVLLSQQSLTVWIFGLVLIAVGVALYLVQLLVRRWRGQSHPS
jgi:amino acid transporter